MPLSSAQLRLARGSVQLGYAWLVYSGLGARFDSSWFDSGLYSQPGLFRSALAQGSARAGLAKSVDLLMSYKSESTYPHGQSFGSQNVVFSCLAWEASEIQFSSVSFDQSCFNRFYLSWARDSVRLGSELGSVGLRMVVRLDSGLVSFLNSGHKDSNRLDSRLCSVCSRPGSARGSSHRTSGLGTVCSRHGSARGSAHRISGLGSAHYSRFSQPRVVDLDRLGDRLEAQIISSMLGSAELRDRLGARFWAGCRLPMT